MDDKKKAGFAPGEYEKLMKQLEQLPVVPGKPGEAGYFNPWNLGRKKSRSKQIACASLPEELP